MTSPKFQIHCVTVPVETVDWSVKHETSEVQPERLVPEKATLGRGYTITVAESGLAGVPQPSVTVTTYVVVVFGLTACGPGPLPILGDQE